MNTAELGLDVEAQSESLFQGLVKRLQFAKSVEEWSRSINSLNRWEDEHLLVDNPSPERLAQHKKILDRLMTFGQFCALVTSCPEFTDSDTANMVFATQQILRDKLRIFHHPVTGEEGARLEQLLKEVFPEP